VPGVDTRMIAKEVTIFTNGNVYIKNEIGEQMSEYQHKINYQHIDKELAMKATIEADNFYVSDFGNWAHKISRHQAQCMLGLFRK